MDFEDPQISQDNSISKEDSNSQQDNMENREKERDRRGRGARGTRFSDADPHRDRSRERRNCRVYISNIPYDYRWQDLKDLFRRVVGSVEYVELFSDENGKPRGCGIVEFKDPDNVEVALEKMNRHEINGRELVVKEDHGENRDQYGRIIRDGMGAPSGNNSGGGGGGGGGGGRGDRGIDNRRFNRMDDENFSRSGSRSGNVGNMMSNSYNDVPYNSYGLSTSFLESLGINGPLHNKVFVANLDYKVDSKKLKQVFKLAGKVQSVDLSVDKEGNSRGFAVVEYDHPVEAVQAISMLDRQLLYERRMTVRLDRIPDKGESVKLPEGLGGVGIGLGLNGEPLRDVARNLPNTQQPQQSIQQSSQSSSNLPSVSTSVNPVVPSGNMLSGGNSGGLNLNSLSSSNLAALSNVVGGLKNLAGVGAALSNPMLSNSLSSLGLNLQGQGVSSGNEDSQQTPTMTNNYSTGNNYSSGYTTPNYASNSSAGNFDNTIRNNYNPGGGQQDSNDFGNQSFGNVGVIGSVGNNGIGTGRKSDTIIIKNIPLSCTWQTLRDKFRDMGEVKFAEIRGNDVGVVRFFKEKDAEVAIKVMDGSRMDGRTISVGYF